MLECQNLSRQWGRLSLHGSLLGCLTLASGPPDTKLLHTLEVTVITEQKTKLSTGTSSSPWGGADSKSQQK